MGYQTLSLAGSHIISIIIILKHVVWEEEAEDIMLRTAVTICEEWNCHPSTYRR